MITNIKGDAMDATYVYINSWLMIPIYVYDDVGNNYDNLSAQILCIGKKEEKKKGGIIEKIYKTRLSS